MGYYRVMCQKRQYSEIASLLQGVSRVMEHFTPYLDIPQVKQLADQVISRISVQDRILKILSFMYSWIKSKKDLVIKFQMISKRRSQEVVPNNHQPSPNLVKHVRFSMS